jgi:hypothetical protein
MLLGTHQGSAHSPSTAADSLAGSPSPSTTPPALGPESPSIPSCRMLLVSHGAAATTEFACSQWEWPAHSQSSRRCTTSAAPPAQLLHTHTYTGEGSRGSSRPKVQKEYTGTVLPTAATLQVRPYRGSSPETGVHVPPVVLVCYRYTDVATRSKAPAPATGDCNGHTTCKPPTPAILLFHYATPTQQHILCDMSTTAGRHMLMRLPAHLLMSPPQMRALLGARAPPLQRQQRQLLQQQPPVPASWRHGCCILSHTRPLTPPEAPPL